MNATVYLDALPVCPSMEKRRELFGTVAAPAAARHATEFRTGMHMPHVDRALAKNQLLVMPDGNARLTCVEGVLWLTREGDFEDYILGPGQSFTSRRGDKITVQAMRPSRLQLAAA
jgi:hypothetical protein